MKKRKLFSLIALILVTLLMFGSCDASFDVGSGGYAGGDFYVDGSYGGSMDGSPVIKGEADMGVTEDSSSAGESTDAEKAPSDKGEPGEDADEGAEDGSEVEDNVIVKPYGLITAAAWNDNDNFAYWRALFEQNTEGDGKFYSLNGSKSWGFDSYNRIKVNVKSADAAVRGARVVAEAEDGSVLFSAVSDSSGVAYLFTGKNSGKVKISSGEYVAEAEFTSETTELTINLDGSSERKNIIDIMFVIDVTGSMGDELSYLKAEIADVVNRICENDEEATVNLALLFYRDDVDQEQFKYYDFTNVTDAAGLAAQQAAIDSQFASGGGDYPESVDEALLMAMDKQWSSGATTKIIFHILDAPPHSTDNDKKNYLEAIESAAEQGIRICPILCSGADTLTEYLTRQAAVYTGGTFIFITDDSGIGNSHHDPNLPNATVEALNSLLVRLVNGYHSGTFEAPVDWRQEVSNAK